MRFSRLTLAVSVAPALSFAGLGTIEGAVAALTGTPWQPALLAFGLLAAGVLQIWKGRALPLILAWGECAALAASSEKCCKITFLRDLPTMDDILSVQLNVELLSGAGRRDGLFV